MSSAVFAQPTSAATSFASSASSAVRRPSSPRPSSAAFHAAPSANFTRRRLRVVVVALALAVFAVLFASNTFADAQSSTGGVVATGGTVVIVQPGDTMWSLARSLQPTGDIRPLVTQLARAHGGAALQAGERIVLPSAS